MVSNPITETVEGVVSTSNARGIRLDGESQSRNFSKWAAIPDALPERGSRVSLNLDRSGFIRSVSPMGLTPAAEPVRIGPEELPAQTRSFDRETAITRMATLNTAVAILGSGARAVEPDAALALAARLEAWVCRS